MKEVNNEVIGVFSENNYEIQTPKRNKMFSEEY